MASNSRGNIPVLVINGALYASRDAKAVLSKVGLIKERCADRPNISPGMVKDLDEAEKSLKEAAMHLDAFFAQVTQQF